MTVGVCTIEGIGKGRCCCNCRFRLTDNHHCTTSPDLVAELGRCVCSLPKGFICAPPEFDGRVHSGWSEHGLCEMHDYRDEPAFKGLPNAEVWYD